MAQPGRPSYRYHMTHRALTNFSEHDFRDSNVPSNGYSVPGRDTPQTPSGQAEPMDPRKRRPDPSSRGNSPLEKRNKYQNDVPTHPSKHSAPGRPGISSSQSLSRRSSGAGPSVMPMKPPSTTESMQNPGNHGRPSQYGQSQASSGAERPREPSIGNNSVVTVSPEGLENRTPTTMERAPPVPSMRPQATGAVVGSNLRENPSISHPNHSGQRARATNTDLPHTLASLQRMKARKAAMSQKSSELAPDQLYTQIGELRRQFAEEREERNKERVEMSNQIKSLQDQLAIGQTQRSNDSGRLEKLETTISTHVESTAKAFEATKNFAAVSAEVKAHSNDINSFKTWKESQISRATADQNADAIRSRVDQQAVTRLQEGMEKLNAQVFEKFEMYSSQHKRDMAKLTEENNQFSSELQEQLDSQNYHDRILAQEQSLSKLKEKFDSQNYQDRILAQEQSLSNLNSRLSDIEKPKDQSAIDTVTKLSELKEKLDSQNYHDRILAQEQSLSELKEKLDSQNYHDRILAQEQSLSKLKEKFDSQNYHDRILAQERSLSNLNSRLSDIEKTKDQSAYDTVTENLSMLLSSIDKTEEDLHNIRINMTALKDDIPQSFARLLDAMKADLEQKFKYINTRMDQQSKEITQLKNQTPVAPAQVPIPPYATIQGHEGLAKNLEKLKDDLDGTTNNLDMEISMRDKHCKDLQSQLDKVAYIIYGLEDRYNNITTADLYQQVTNWLVQTHSPAVNVVQRLPQLENDFYKLYNSLGSLDEFAGQLREWRALTGYTEDLKRLPQLYHDFDRLRSEASKDNDTLKRNVDFNRALADELSKDCENLKKAITQLTADRTSTTEKQLIEELQKNVRQLENSIRATEISVHFEREERENTTKRLDLDLTNLQAMEETQAKAIDRMKGLMADEDQKLSNRVESRLDSLRHQLDTIMGAYVNDNMELFGAWPGIVCAMIEIQKVVQDLNRNLDPAKRLKIQWTDVGDLMNQIKQTAAKK